MRIKDYNNRNTVKEMASVKCSDWHLTWGFGTNKIGRLYYDPKDDIYIWRGHCQGRHGNKWNENSEYHFKMVAGKVEEVWTNQGSGILPRRDEFQKSINELNSIIKNR